MFKKYLLKTLPYIASTISGFFIYYASNKVFGGKLNDLLINISAAFISIPLLYLFYELIKSFAHKKLNKEIFDYAKMQIDRELLSLLNQLYKIVFILETKDFSSKGINVFLSIDKNTLIEQFRTNKYIGFQLFKNWEFCENGIKDLLKNTFILDKMEDNQIIDIITILKSLYSLESFQKIDDLYNSTKEIAHNYKIQSGTNINSDNILADRYLLLKHISGDKYIVSDFGDIPKYNLDKCLTYYVINNKYSDYYCDVILNLNECIRNWLSHSGNEFIIDTKMFRLRGKYFT
jgi:hypothetical protein